SDRRFDDFLAPTLRVGITRQTDHADPISVGRRQFEAQFLALCFQEFVWNLDENSGSVYGVLFAAFRSTVLQVDEYLKRPPDDVVGFPACDVDHKPNTARVVLESRLV